MATSGSGAWARFDSARCYRYALGRAWGGGEGRVAWIMLNPSAADEVRDDPTIRRCVGFARSWGFRSLEVVNLFAWRTADPAELRRAAAPVGPANDAAIREAVRRASMVVAAWGVHGGLLQRSSRVLDLLAEEGTRVCCLGLTRAGSPRHPLYVPGGVQPVAFRHAATADAAAAS